MVVTDRWPHNQRIISTLQRIAARKPLVDPTGLLGPLDPDRRRPADGTPPVGAVITGTRPNRTTTRDHRNLGTQL